MARRHRCAASGRDARPGAGRPASAHRGAPLQILGERPRLFAKPMGALQTIRLPPADPDHAVLFVHLETQVPTPQRSAPEGGPSCERVPASRPRRTTSGKIRTCDHLTATGWHSPSASAAGWESRRRREAQHGDDRLARIAVRVLHADLDPRRGADVVGVLAIAGTGLEVRPPGRRHPVQAREQLVPGTGFGEALVARIGGIDSDRRTGPTAAASLNDCNMSKGML